MGVNKPTAFKREREKLRLFFDWPAYQDSLRYPRNAI